MSVVDTKPRGPGFLRGAVVGAYTIERELGRGAGGVVYLAGDGRLGRRVALKVLQTGWSAPDDLRRFTEEMRTTARFSHPHIVTVYAADQHEGIPYLALEYVEGQTLRKRMESGPFRETEVVRAAREIALALREAHAAGFIHADLKPENVMVTAQGAHKVMDFGLARMVGGEQAIASGTPAYMAPERWGAAPPSKAMDVWALGAMVFEMMEGRRPLLDHQLGVQPPPTIVLPPRSADASFADVLLRMLDPDPARRPSAQEVVLAMTEEPRLPESNDRPPFRGLRAYELGEASEFMGREADVDQALTELRRERTLLLVGPSGVGKTSFLRAGVLPRLRDERALRLVELRPGVRPTASLMQALSRGLELSGAFSELQFDTRSVLLIAQRAQLQTNRSLVLVVDQLEELFTLAEPQEVEAFARALAALVAETDLTLILSMRDDFLGRLAQVSDLERYLRRVQVLRPLAARTLAAIVHQALRRVGYATDTPGLINQVVADVSAQPAPLPLLQFVCGQLWERRDTTAQVIRAQEYEAMGRAAGALASHGDQVLAGLTPAQVARVRKIMVRLANPDGTRKPRTWRELTEGGEDAGPLLQLLIDKRLLSASRLPDTDETSVELAHEALATLWATLVGWLSETVDSRRQLDEVEAAARGWVTRGRREDETWSQSTVEETDRRLDTLRPSLSPEAREFLRVARARHAESEARRRRVRWAVTIVLSIVAAGALGLSGWLLRQQELIRLAEGNYAAIELALAPFDVDGEGRVVDAPPVSGLGWRLHDARSWRRERPGAPTIEAAKARLIGDGRWAFRLKAQPSVLAIHRPGCDDSIVPLANVPGYTDTLPAPARLRVPFPTCAASSADMVLIPEGVLHHVDETREGVLNRETRLATFFIDRYEVSHALMTFFWTLAPITGLAAPPNLSEWPEDYPAVAIRHNVAAAFCSYFGKRLPTDLEWRLAAGAAARAVPEPSRASLEQTPGVRSRVDNFVPVRSQSADVTPRGVLHLAWNAREWTVTEATDDNPGMYVIKGGPLPPHSRLPLVDFVNMRPPETLDYQLGFRCVR